MGVFDCCCTAANCGTLDFTVNGCGAPTPGAVVTVSGPGGFSASCTTNGSGNCSVSIAASGTYTGTVTKTGFNAGSFSKTVASCVAGSHNVVATVTLAVATGYSCTPDCCGGQPGPPYFPVTWPDPIFVNDGIGTVTLSLTVLAGNRPLWTGVATRTAALAFDCNFNNGVLITCGKFQTAQTVTLHFSVGCSTPNGTLAVQIGYYPCSNFSSSPGCAFAPGSCGHTDSVSVVEDLGCGCTFGAVACGANFPCCVQGAIGHGSAHGFSSTNGTLPCPPSMISTSATISCGTGGGGFGDTVCNSLAGIYGGPPMTIPLTITS